PQMHKRRYQSRQRRSLLLDHRKCLVRARTGEQYHFSTHSQRAKQAGTTQSGIVSDRERRDIHARFVELQRFRGRSQLVGVVIMSTRDEFGHARRSARQQKERYVGGRGTTFELDDIRFYIPERWKLA